MLNEYEGSWIGTFTGKEFHYLNPSLDEICIEDIAHALSLICRFGGHCKEFYSAAEHSYRVAELVDPKDKLAALFHDASEAYLLDFPKPIKMDMPQYKILEGNLQQIIHEKFNITVHYRDHLKFIDEVLLATEARDLMATTKNWKELPSPLVDKIIPVSSKIAENRFIEHYFSYMSLGRRINAG